MLSNLNIPLPTPSNRRTARRLLHFVTGFTQVLCLSLTLLFFIFTPRPTYSTTPDSFSLWFGNNYQALSFFEKNLGYLPVSGTNLTLFEILQFTQGPYTLSWNIKGDLTAVHAQANPTHRKSISGWQATSPNIHLNKKQIVVGQPESLNTRFWPKLPWQTGISSFNSPDPNITSYTINTPLNRLLFRDPLLERTTADLSSPNTTIALALNENQAALWKDLELPLSFPGLSALLDKLSTTNSTLSLNQNSTTNVLQLALQAPLSPLEATTLIQDLLLGTNQITEESSDSSGFSYFGQTKDKSARVIVTPQSTSITLTLPNTSPAVTPVSCLKNPLARISSNILSSTLPFQSHFKNSHLIIESNSRTTGVCFVDN